MVFTAENVSDNQIISLWQECFGDDREYISAFLKAHSDRRRILTVQNGEELCSMLFLLECETVCSGEAFKSWYIYAACTAEKYRKRGMMGELLDYAKNYAEENGVSFILLVPAEKYLFDYYGKFGYKTRFYRQSKTLKINKLNLDETLKTEITSDELFSLRERCLKNLFHVKWNTQSLDYALSEYAVSFTDKAFALWYIEDDTLKIAEISETESGEAKKILNRLMSKNNISEVKYFTPCTLSKDSEPFGMALPIDFKAEEILRNNTCGYLGLALD